MKMKMAILMFLTSAGSAVNAATYAECKPKGYSEGPVIEAIKSISVDNDTIVLNRIEKVRTALGLISLKKDFQLTGKFNIEKPGDKTYDLAKSVDSQDFKVIRNYMSDISKDDASNLEIELGFKVLSLTEKQMEITFADEKWKVSDSLVIDNFLTTYTHYTCERVK